MAVSGQPLLLEFADATLSLRHARVRIGKYGRRMLTVLRLATKKPWAKWPADAIRLDACDADAGAGQFYAMCGYRKRGRAVYKGNPLVYYELLL